MVLRELERSLFDPLPPSLPPQVLLWEDSADHVAAVAHLHRPGLLGNGQLRLADLGALPAGAAHHGGRAEDAANCARLHSSGEIHNE